MKRGKTMKLITPFHSKYLEHGANMIDVLGWQLAGVFTSVEEEHRIVRERAGFTDYAFQSAFAVSGKDAFFFRVGVEYVGPVNPNQCLEWRSGDKVCVTPPLTMEF